MTEQKIQQEIDTKQIVKDETSRQQDFGYEPSYEDMVIAGGKAVKSLYESKELPLCQQPFNKHIPPYFPVTGHCFSDGWCKCKVEFGDEVKPESTIQTDASILDEVIEKTFGLGTPNWCNDKQKRRCIDGKLAAMKDAGYVLLDDAAVECVADWLYTQDGPRKKRLSYKEAAKALIAKVRE